MLNKKQWTQISDTKNSISKFQIKKFELIIITNESHSYDQMKQFVALGQAKMDERNVEVKFILNKIISNKHSVD